MSGVGSMLCLSRVLLALSLLSTVPLARAVSLDELERLRAATREYPDDPDLAWALAAALRDSGRQQDALDHFRRNGERWPDWRAQYAFERGRLLYERGEFPGALDAFETAIYLDPLGGSARLYRALALQELGRRADAERELRVLERLEPELKAETLLLRAMNRMEVGDQIGSQRLLQEVIALDPTSPPARRASLFLDARPRDEVEDPILSTWVQIGTELDSNVTLDSGTDLGGVSTGQADASANWGGGFVWQPLRTEWGTLSLGYRYSESSHEDLKAFNLQSHLLFSSLSFDGPGRLSKRIDGMVSSVHLDDDRYAHSWLVRPNLFVLINNTWGVSRLYVEYLRRSYHDEPLFSSLDRDGTTYGIGVEHYLPLPGWEGSLASIAMKLARTDSEASRDPLGFEGDYDRRRAEIRTQLKLPLGAAFDLSISGGVAWERYRNENLIDALTDNGVGTPTPSKRRDLIGDATLALGWSISPHLRLELRWQNIRDRSNVDVYDYSRSIVGVQLMAERSWP
ncbi:MAG: tetratricopeptide repeat protein [Deltaproteobacteria bacterium]|nr:tetratricopeptide repeat protein [Deltaproteobacteria bacterium]